ncbi:MAG: SRPBCC family protein [Nocardioides sp.]|nr:SRPBCC family protein [Nocardioides sp.]
MRRIELETYVAAPVDDVFELSLSVDAHTASMRDSGERIVAGVTSGSMSLGDTVTWRARHLGWTFTMTSRISEYDAPHRFVDEQVSGPFASWRHEHRFVASGAGTTMVDVAEFRAPLGVIGVLAERAVLTVYLTRLLRQRNDFLVRAVAG